MCGKGYWVRKNPGELPASSTRESSTVAGRITLGKGLTILTAVPAAPDYVFLPAQAAVELSDEEAIPVRAICNSLGIGGSRRLDSGGLTTGNCGDHDRERNQHCEAKRFHD